VKVCHEVLNDALGPVDY